MITFFSTLYVVKNLIHTKSYTNTYKHIQNIYNIFPIYESLSNY